MKIYGYYDLLAEAFATQDNRQTTSNHFTHEHPTGFPNRQSS